MELSEFIEATSRLENYYGKEYTTEQRRIMHEELKNLTVERYRQLISAIMRKSKFLPKIADFLEADMELPHQQKEVTESVECEVCHGEGYVYYKKIIPSENLEYNYACRCICQNGQSKNKDIPTFQELGIMPNERVEIKANE